MIRLPHDCPGPTLTAARTAAGSRHTATRRRPRRQDSGSGRSQRPVSRVVAVASACGTRCCNRLRPVRRMPYMEHASRRRGRVVPE
jgi:hypothetical protein